METSDNGQNTGLKWSIVLSYLSLLTLLLAIVSAVTNYAIIGVSSIAWSLVAAGSVLIAIQFVAREAKEGGGRPIPPPPGPCPPDCETGFFYVSLIVGVFALVALFTSGEFLRISALEYFMIVVVLSMHVIKIVLREGGGKGGSPPPPPPGS